MFIGAETGFGLQQTDYFHPEEGYVVSKLDISGCEIEELC